MVTATISGGAAGVSHRGTRKNVSLAHHEIATALHNGVIITIPSLNQTSDKEYKVYLNKPTSFSMQSDRQLVLILLTLCVSFHVERS